MFVGLGKNFYKGQTVAVAVSGGSDSMALLHYLHANADAYGIKVVAVNVEHGIRGQASLDDSTFVKNYCAQHEIPLKQFTVNAPQHATNNKLSLEESARALRYTCFKTAIESGFCDKVATAHHRQDNVESVLFNLFRGAGLKGASGIEPQTANGIIRPFLYVDKTEIEEYIIANGVPYVTDQTNFDTDYTRNDLRLNVIPAIEKVFPEAQKSVERFSQIAKIEDDYMRLQATNVLTENNGEYEIQLPCHQAVFNRATVLAVKNLGIEKDWEKTHVDDCFSLTKKENGASVNLPKGIIAVKEYDKIVFYKPFEEVLNRPFALGEFVVGNVKYNVMPAPLTADLTDGLYIDRDKIPQTAIIRFFEEGDYIVKFGGGKKSLGDYFTDKKIPVRKRKALPVIADGNKVYAVFTIAISNDARVDNQTKAVVQLI